LAAGNLRKLSYLFRRYLSCARIDEDRLKRAVFERRTTGQSDYRLRLNTILTAFLTGHQKTFFSHSEEMQPLRDCLVNVYCNNKHRVNGCLIRIHLLKMLKPAAEGAGLRFSEIADQYWEWVGASGRNRVDRVDCDAAVEYAVRRLLDCNLLATPDYYRIDGTL